MERFKRFNNSDTRGIARTYYNNFKMANKYLCYVYERAIKANKNCVLKVSQVSLMTSFVSSALKLRLDEYPLEIVGFYTRRS